MARKARRQRVTFRFKRREQLKHHVRAVIVRSMAIALVVGFGAVLMSGRDPFLARFLRRHIPQITINSPQALAGLPVLADIPKYRLWLWIPGSGFWLQKRIGRRYAAVRSIRLHRAFEANTITLSLEPRVPLVTCNGAGFDRVGMLFAILPGTWKVMPQAVFLPNARKPELGQWLARLNAVPEIWSQILFIRQAAPETIELTLKTGAVIVWGAPETEPLLRKARVLLRILDDAHANLGGAARADLRFFDQGRIIVRPKGAAIER